MLNNRVRSILRGRIESQMFEIDRLLSDIKSVRDDLKFEYPDRSIIFMMDDALECIEKSKELLECTIKKYLNEKENPNAK